MSPHAVRIWLVALVLLFAAPALAQTDPLPSWTDGATKTRIVDFVTAVTMGGGPDFVPPEARIATFDNDGTLWVEKPLPTQLYFVFDRIRAMAADHPDWKTTEPYASVIKGDLKGLAASGDKAIADLMAATHSGMSTDQFQAMPADTESVAPKERPAGVSAAGAAGWTALARVLMNLDEFITRE